MGDAKGPALSTPTKTRIIEKERIMPLGQINFREPTR